MSSESLGDSGASLFRSRPMERTRGRLQDKVALITGSARGIGATTALTFAHEGAKVVICDVNAELGQEMATKINHMLDSDQPAAIFLPVNVVDSTSVAQMVQQTVAHFGRLDILVNNAGVTRDAQLKKMSDADFNFVIDINLKGVFTCGRAAANQMLDQGNGGVILNAASIVGLDGNFGQTNYAAAKAAVISMTKVWSRELGPNGIRVNAVAPGFIDTPMTAQMPEKIYQKMVDKTPLRRAGQAQDVADAYLWLASEEASFVNGIVLRVDGGIVIGT